MAVIKRSIAATASARQDDGGTLVAALGDARVRVHVCADGVANVWQTWRCMLSRCATAGLASAHHAGGRRFDSCRPPPGTAVCVFIWQMLTF